MFTNNPEYFSASLENLIFEYESDEVKDLTVEIRDAYTLGEIGNKLFFSSSHIFINVAPYLRHLSEPTPNIGASGQVEDMGARGAVILFRGVDASSPCKFIKNSIDAPLEGLLAASSLQRTIAPDEQDIIAIRSSQNINISASAYLPSGELSVQSLYDISAEDDDIFFIRLNAADFPSAAAIDLSIDWGEASSTINYTIVRRAERQVRIAWINSMGGTEHYSFPRIESESIDESGKRVIGCTSAYEPYETIAALGEASFAPYAWLVDESGYRPITIQSGTFNIIVDGELSLAELKFSEDV
ncbi:MAG: hypothetical protein SNG47_04095 [Rikenellaceae bacterium]